MAVNVRASNMEFLNFLNWKIEADAAAAIFFCCESHLNRTMWGHWPAASDVKITQTHCVMRMGVDCSLFSEQIAVVELQFAFRNIGP